MKPQQGTAWLEAQYNNRARVPDFQRVFDRWQAASELALRQPSALLDVAYGSGAGERLDIHPPAIKLAGGAPVLVFIHGGYWRSLDKAQHAFVAPVYNAAGALVMVPNYALCPTVTVEHIVLQMARMLAWVWRNAAAYGGDPSRIVLVGHSAGGHLATMLLSCRWREIEPDMPLQPLAGALSISGLYDLEPLRHVPGIQSDLKLTPAAVARLSPAFFPRPKSTRLYTVAGLDESDEFLRQNHLIRDVWGPTAVPVCETLPGVNHFTVLNGLAEPGHRLNELALRLLGLH